MKQTLKVKETTINTRLRGLRAFFNHCISNGYISKKIEILLIKTTREMKETYTREEIGLLLKKPNLKKCSFAEYRDWAIISYFIGTGNRLKTVVNIKIGDVDLYNNFVKLRHTKNRKQQVIPIPESLVHILMEYLERRGGCPEDWLFCSVFGGKLDKNTVYQAVRKYNLKRGVEKTSIHLFRYFFAKEYLLGGGDPYRLQKLLGHSSMEMVKRYLSWFDEDLQVDYNKFNPLERILQSSNQTAIKIKR